MVQLNPDFPPREGLTLPGGIIVLPKEAALVTRYGGRINNASLFDRPIPLGMTNMSAVFKSDGFVADVIRRLRLRRLARIHQLQQLTYLTVEQRTPSIPGPHVFDHTRLMPHSLLAATLRALICQFVLGASEQETLVAVLEDLVHDALTCAGGDSWRTLPGSIVTPTMRTLFDEDAQILQVFDSNYPSWIVLRDAYGLPHDTPSRVATTVGEERGITGELHSLTDTLSYLACDLERLIYWHRHHKLDLPPHLVEAANLARPDVFHIWQESSVVDGHMVIRDHELLHRMLELRIALWGGVYQHPGHKILEMHASNVMYPYLIGERKIDIKKLLTWSDRELFHHLTDVLAQPHTTTHLTAFGDMPERTSYATLSDAKAAEADAARDGGYTLHMDLGTFQPTKTKAQSYRVEANGQVQLFADAYPDRAEKLRVKAQSFADGNRYHLAVVHRPQISAPLRLAWHQARERWFSE